MISQYILYSIDRDVIVTPIVYRDYESAVTKARRWNDVLVLKLKEPDELLEPNIS